MTTSRWDDVCPRTGNHPPNDKQRAGKFGQLREAVLETRTDKFLQNYKISNYKIIAPTSSTALHPSKDALAWPSRSECEPSARLTSLASGPVSKCPATSPTLQARGQHSRNPSRHENRDRVDSTAATKEAANPKVSGIFAILAASDMSRRTIFEAVRNAGQLAGEVRSRDISHVKRYEEGPCVLPR